MWFIATSGTPSDIARPFAALSPTISAGERPGPYVTATSSILPLGHASRNFAIAVLTTSDIFSTWAREAISGTTPPYGWWSGIWV